MPSSEALPAVTTPAAHELAYFSLLRKYVEFYDFETATLDVESATSVIDKEIGRFISLGMPLSHVAREAWRCELELRDISDERRLMMPEDFNV